MFLLFRMTILFGEWNDQMPLVAFNGRAKAKDFRCGKRSWASPEYSDVALWWNCHTSGFGNNRQALHVIFLLGVRFIWVHSAELMDFTRPIETWTNRTLRHLFQRVKEYPAKERTGNDCANLPKRGRSRCCYSGSNYCNSCTNFIRAKFFSHPPKRPSPLAESSDK